MVPERSKDLAWMALVFAVALAVRLWHVAEIRPSPFFEVLVGDARAYDAWAQRIAAGDWFGQDVFYQAPLYPYFLGTLYALAGRDLLVVRLVQVTLGALACVFLAAAAARLFGPRVGIVAGLLLALYAPAVFFDALIQKTVLDGILICLALAAISGLIVSPRSPWRWWWLGSVLGLLALTRENAMVLAAVVACWSIARDDRVVQTGAGLRERILFRTVPFLLGLAVVLLPVAARNYAVGGGFFVTTSQFGSNFYLGNNPHTDGTAGSLVAGRGAAEYEQRDAIELAERATGRSLSPGEVSAFWTDRALSFISSQPGAWMRLMGRKVLLLVNKTEMLDTESQESYAEWSTPLRIGSIVGHFGVLVPLAAIGLIWTWPDRRRLWVLYALGGAYAASVVLFFIYARYRYPLVPMLAIFAAVGLIALSTKLTAWGKAEDGQRSAAPAAMPSRGTGFYPRRGISVRTRRGWGPGASEKEMIPLILGVAGLIALCNWPLLSASRMRAITEHNYGAALQSDGRLDDAIRHYERAVAVDPTYAPAYSNMGAALLANGRSDGAKRAYQQALQIDPDFADAHFNLGNALLREGNPAGAIEQFEQARRTMPGVADVHHNLGVAFAEAGRVDEAAAAFERALALSPASIETLTALADFEASRGRGAAALDYLRRAVQLRPEDASAHYNLARQLLESERPAESIPEFEAAVRLAPNHAQTRNDFGIALATLGRADAAREQFLEALRVSPGFEAAARNLAALRAAR